MRLPTRLLQRKPDSNKGDFGHILVLAGSARYSGAAALCGHAAMRSGAGLVTLGIPKSLNNAIIKIKPREIMTLPLPETKEASLASKSFQKIKEFSQEADVIVIGPGLTKNKETLRLSRQVIGAIDKPMVIDADGLNALVGHLDLLLNSHNSIPTPRVLTPHPGEMGRLLGVSVKKVQERRKEVAQKFASDYNCTLVLKGNKTVVASSSGACYVNNTGNAGMATAGSGDCLTGMIAAFLGQGLNAFDAAKCAVYLHGLAGDLAEAEKTKLCLIASDIIDKITEAVKRSV